MNYDQKILKFADNIAATLSKDPSTKIGAVVVENKSIITIGYNGMPRNLNDNAKERIERENLSGNVPVKYSWFEHGERNAIYNMAHNASLFQNKIMLILGEIDIEDLRCAISAGIKKIFLVKEASPNLIINHNESNKIAQEMVEESKAELILLDANDLSSLGDKFNGKAEKLNKKIKLLSDYSSLFARPYSFKGSDGKTFSKSCAATLIFDATTYSDLSFGVTGLIERMNDVFDESSATQDDYDIYAMGSVRNAIYDAITPLMKGKTMYVNLCPCIDCAKAMASVAVNCIVFPKADQDTEVVERWKKSFDLSVNYLNFFNVKKVIYSKN